MQKYESRKKFVRGFQDYLYTVGPAYWISMWDQEKLIT